LDKKKNALEAKNLIFLGLIEAAFSGNFLGFLGMFFMFLERTFPLPLDLDHVWSISLHITLSSPWLTNNLVFIYTNNMSIMIYNLRVLVLNWNLFFPNRDDLMKIEVNEPLILDHLMICNLSMLLISWNLEWIWVHVIGFILGVLRVLYFLCGWSILFKKVLSFYVF